MTAGSTLTVEDVLDLLSRRLPYYEDRPQQLLLARQIERSFVTGTTGLFEAGTGTGKSLSAMIPAILSGKKVVVSTNTISLQEQYISKDIPVLQEVLPFQFEAALLKGRGNYLGLRRWEEHLLEQATDDRLLDWVNTTDTGDISELDFVPPFDVWYEVNSDSDDCLRNRCPRFTQCFYFEAKRRAEKANVLVVNHALLLADAASMGSILPPYDLLVIDEAHHLPDVATDSFSLGVSNAGIRILCNKALRRVQAPPGLVQDLEYEAAEFFQRLASNCRYLKTRFRTKIDGAADLGLTMKALRQWLDNQTFDHLLDVDLARDRAKLKAKSLISTIDGYIACLDLMANPSPEWVVWAERADLTGTRLHVIAAPLDVASHLQSHLFDRPDVQATVMMSATLATTGDDPFGYFKRSCGIDMHVIQEKINSPFNYSEQAVLYLPRSMPEPNSPQFTGRALEEIHNLLEFSEGRAFVLFTSKAALNAAYDQVSPQVIYPCKKQGDMPRQRLIEWFLSTPNSVLFGTSSFWEGVSVDGDQLSCVIIDRLPFQTPDDPIYEARCDKLKNDMERSWFNELALPHATMRLKQGVGRLIRTARDCGLVAVLDGRLTSKQYGRKILECLPPMRIIRTIGGPASLDAMFCRDYSACDQSEGSASASSLSDDSTSPGSVGSCLTRQSDTGHRSTR